LTGFRITAQTGHGPIGSPPCFKGAGPVVPGVVMPSAIVWDDQHIALRERLAALVQRWDQRIENHDSVNFPMSSQAIGQCRRELATLLQKPESSQICPDCDHGVAGGLPCQTCGGSGYAR